MRGTHHSLVIRSCIGLQEGAILFCRRRGGTIRENSGLLASDSHSQFLRQCASSLSWRPVFVSNGATASIPCRRRKSPPSRCRTFACAAVCRDGSVSRVFAVEQRTPSCTTSSSEWLTRCTAARTPSPCDLTGQKQRMATAHSVAWRGIAWGFHLVFRTALALGYPQGVTVQPLTITVADVQYRNWVTGMEREPPPF